eukprot:Tbor_TRINITY_DN5189_c2_g10::TRINITY_DN5189_c2_g10_i1::g.25915::m.25915
MSNRLLPALRRRMMHFGATPEKYVDAYDPMEAVEGANPGWMWSTFYASSIDLGLMTEPEARHYLHVIPKYADKFRAMDIGRALVLQCTYLSPAHRKSGDYPDIIHPTTYLSTGAASVVADAFRPFLQGINGTIVARIPPCNVLSMIRALVDLKIDTDSSSPLLELKNFLLGRITYNDCINDLSDYEVAEMFLCIVKMGRYSHHLTEEVMEKYIKRIEERPYVAATMMSAISRATGTIPLSSNCPAYVRFAFQTAMEKKYGLQHRIIVLRALVEMEKHPHVPSNNVNGEIDHNFSEECGKMATKLLEQIKDEGLLNIEGPNIGMIFSVLAAKRDVDNSLFDDIFSSFLPQVYTATASTISSISKNSAFLGIQFPVRLADSMARRSLELLPNETTLSGISLLTGVASVGSTSKKVRLSVAAGVTYILNNRHEQLSPADYASLTHCLALAMGRYRNGSTSGNGEVPRATTHEMDLGLLDSILMHISSLSRDRRLTVQIFNDILRNLAELDISYDELKPFIYRCYGINGGISKENSTLVLNTVNTHHKNSLVSKSVMRFSIDQIARLIRTMNVCQCDDPVLLRAIHCQCSGRKRLSAQEQKTLDNLMKKAGM